MKKIIIGLSLVTAAGGAYKLNNDRWEAMLQKQQEDFARKENIYMVEVKRQAAVIWRLNDDIQRSKTGRVEYSPLEERCFLDKESEKGWLAIIGEKFESKEEARLKPYLMPELSRELVHDADTLTNRKGKVIVRHYSLQPLQEKMGRILGEKAPDSMALAEKYQEFRRHLLAEMHLLTHHGHYENLSLIDKDSAELESKADILRRVLSSKVHTRMYDDKKSLNRDFYPYFMIQAVLQDRMLVKGNNALVEDLLKKNREAERIKFEKDRENRRIAYADSVKKARLPRPEPIFYKDLQEKKLWHR